MPARKSATPAVADDQSTWPSIDLLEFIRPAFLSLRPFMARGDLSNSDTILMVLAIQAPFMVSARLILLFLSSVANPLYLFLESFQRRRRPRRLRGRTPWLGSPAPAVAYRHVRGYGARGSRPSCQCGDLDSTIQEAPPLDPQGFPTARRPSLCAFPSSCAPYFGRLFFLDRRPV